MLGIILKLIWKHKRKKKKIELKIFWKTLKTKNVYIHSEILKNTWIFCKNTQTCKTHNIQYCRDITDWRFYLTFSSFYKPLFLFNTMFVIMFESIETRNISMSVHFLCFIAIVFYVPPFHGCNFTYLFQSIHHASPVRFQI